MRSAPTTLSTILAGSALILTLLAFSMYYAAILGSYAERFSKVASSMFEPEMTLTVYTNLSGVYGVLKIISVGNKISNVIVHYDPPCFNRSVYIAKPVYVSREGYKVLFPWCSASKVMIVIIDEKGNKFYYRLDKDPLHRGPLKYWISLEDLNATSMHNGVNDPTPLELVVACGILRNVYGIECNESTLLKFRAANITVEYNFTSLLKTLSEILGLVDGVAKGVKAATIELTVKLDASAYYNLKRRIVLVYEITPWIKVSEKVKCNIYGWCDKYVTYEKRLIINGSTAIKFVKEVVGPYQKRTTIRFATFKLQKWPITILLSSIGYSYAEYSDVYSNGYDIVTHIASGPWELSIYIDLPFTVLPIASSKRLPESILLDRSSNYNISVIGFEGSRFVYKLYYGRGFLVSTKAIQPPSVQAYGKLWIYGLVAKVKLDPRPEISFYSFNGSSWGKLKPYCTPLKIQDGNSWREWLEYRYCSSYLIHYHLKRVKVYLGPPQVEKWVGYDIGFSIDPRLLPLR